MEDCVVPRTQRPKSMQQTISGKHPKRLGVRNYRNDDMMMELLKFKECLLTEENRPAVIDETKKLHTLISLKQKAKQPIFVQVMRSLFATRDFYKIKSANIQADLIESISSNGVVDLIDSLVKFQRDNEYKKLLDAVVSERLDQCIVDLGIQYQMQKRRKNVVAQPTGQRSISKNKSSKLFMKAKNQIADDRNQILDATFI